MKQVAIWRLEKFNMSQHNSGATAFKLKDKWLYIALGLIIILAFLVRLGIVFMVEMPKFSYSENSAIAINMFQGKGYVYPLYGLRPDNPLQSFVPPLYTWVVWLCLSLFAKPALALGIVQAILSTLSLPLIFYFTLKLTSNRMVALLTTAGVGFYPVFILAVTRPEALTLNIFIISLLLALSVKLQEKPHLLWLSLTGFVLGLMLYSRPMFIFYLPLLAVWLYLNGLSIKGVFKVSGIILVWIILVLLPWSIRNYTVHQKFIYVATNGGFNFWTGNNPFTTGSGHEVYTEKVALFLNKKAKKNDPPIKEMHRYPLPAHIADRIETINEVELDRQLYQAGFTFIREQPQAWFTLLAIKLRSFIWFRPNIGQRFDETWTQYYKYLYAILFTLFITGMAISLKAWRKYSLLYMLFGAYTIFYVMFQVQTRYRWEIEAYFFIFVSLSLLYGFKIIQPAMPQSFKNRFGWS